MAQPLPATMQGEYTEGRGEYAEGEEDLGSEEMDEEYNKHADEMMKKRQELIEKIKNEYHRNPKLNLSPDGTIRRKLEEYDLEQLEDVYDNIQVQKVFGGPLTAREQGLYSAMSAGLKYLTGFDIYDDLVADESIKIDLREVTGGWLGPDAPLANLLSKTVAIIAKRARTSFLTSPQHEAPLERDERLLQSQSIFTRFVGGQGGGAAPAASSPTSQATSAPAAVGATQSAAPF